MTFTSSHCACQDQKPRVSYAKRDRKYILRHCSNLYLLSYLLHHGCFYKSSPPPLFPSSFSFLLLMSLRCGFSVHIWQSLCKTLCKNFQSKPVITHFSPCKCRWLNLRFCRHKIQCKFANPSIWWTASSNILLLHANENYLYKVIFSQCFYEWVMVGWILDFFCCQC